MKYFESNHLCRALSAQTGKFVWHMKYLASVETYVVFNQRPHRALAMSKKCKFLKLQLCVNGCRTHPLQACFTIQNRMKSLLNVHGSFHNLNLSVHLLKKELYTDKNRMIE